MTGPVALRHGAASFVRSGGRDPDGEPGAAARCVAGSHLPPMRGRQFGHDGQPDTAPAGAVGLPTAPEPLEDVREFVPLDPGAVVSDLQHGIRPIGDDGDRDLSTG